MLSPYSGGGGIKQCCDPSVCPSVYPIRYVDAHYVHIQLLLAGGMLLYDYANMLFLYRSKQLWCHASITEHHVDRLVS